MSASDLNEIDELAKESGLTRNAYFAKVMRDAMESGLVYRVDVQRHYKQGTHDGLMQTGTTESFEDLPDFDVISEKFVERKEGSKPVKPASKSSSREKKGEKTE